MAITYVKKAPSPPTDAPAPAPVPSPQLIAETPAQAPAVVLPWDEAPIEASTPKQSVLQALALFHEQKLKPPALSLVSTLTGRSYIVLDWTPGMQRVRLKGDFNMILNPHITEREESIYVPVWR